MSNKFVVQNFNVNPNELALTGTYTQNLANLTSNTLSSALARLDQMVIPSVSNNAWTLLSSQSVSAAGVSLNFPIDTAQNYSMLQLLFWLQSTASGTSNGLFLTFNNDTTSGAYRRDIIGYGYPYSGSGGTLASTGTTGTNALLVSSSGSAFPANAITYGTANLSIAINGFRHCVAQSSSDITGASIESVWGYTNYSNTSTAISSIQVFTNNSTYNGYVKLYAIK